ncbi:MAG TPA: hypothetical protein VMV53_12085 [Acidimicrobiales bacterium]|nr:hypothetical protein [Acidimicrobiales bacterium]
MSAASGATWPASPVGSLRPDDLEFEVVEAVREIAATLSEDVVVAWPDGEGGVFVVVDDIDIGAQWTPQVTWLGCRILNAYPEADVYPLFVRGDLKRSDGAAFAAPFNPGSQFASQAAVTVSRTSPRRSPTTASAVARLINTMNFLREAR